MARKRKQGVDLPRHVHRVRSRGRDYYYYHPGRGTPAAAKPVALPHDPQSSEFWKALETLTGTPTDEPGTVADLIARYLDSPEFAEKSEATQKNYRIYLGKLKQKIGPFPATDIRPRHIMELRDLYAATPAAANQVVHVAGTLFVWGVPRDFVSGNPCRDVPSLKTGEGHMPWPEWAFVMMRESFRDELRIACELALYTGQRQGDVLRMKLSDFEDDGVMVRQSKTGKRLWVPIHIELQPVIEECRARGNLYLVSRRDGQPLTARNFQSLFANETRKVAHRRFREERGRFHGLRKSATVKLRESGCTTGQIQAVTGMSLAMVEHYSRGVDQRAMARDAITKWEQNTG